MEYLKMLTLTWKIANSTSGMQTIQFCDLHAMSLPFFFGTTRMDAYSLLKRLIRNTCSIMADMVVVQTRIGRVHE
jgi:hypothetical protein